MPASSLLRRPALALALGLCCVAAITTLLGRIAGGPQSQSKPVALADVDGLVAYPALSPDGNRLAYCQRGASPNDSFHVYTRRLPTGSVTPLTPGVEGAGDISPAWSPDGGRIAFLRVGEDKAAIYTIPSAGGAETRVAEITPPDTTYNLPALSWSRDGRTLAVATGGNARQPSAITLVSLADGALHPATTPSDDSGDTSPAFSPDGARLAFVRGANPDSGDIYVAGANGANPRRLTFDQSQIRGLAWLPQGAELVYSAARNNRIRLWRVSLANASPREVIGADSEARFPTLSLTGGRLAYTESPMVTSIWRTAVVPDGSQNAADPAADRSLIRSAGHEKLAAYSPDGKRIADISDQSGFEDIWISGADGADRTRITNMAAAPEHPSLGRPVWSPDGKSLLFTESTGYRNEIWKIAAEPNSKPVLVVGSASAPEWSRDGKSIFYMHNGQIFKAAADGVGPKQLTSRMGNGAPIASPDGKFVYFRFRGAGIWRVPVNGGEEESVLEAEGPVLGDPYVTKDGIYYLSVGWIQARPEGPGHPGRGLSILFYDFAGKKITPRFALTGGRNFNFTPAFSVSPDGKYALYTRMDQAHANLMLVEGFR